MMVVGREVWSGGQRLKKRVKYRIVELFSFKTLPSSARIWRQRRDHW